MDSIAVQPSKSFHRYTVSTSDRIWFISVQCQAELDTKTSASVTYTFTSLNSVGHKFNEMALEKMYRYNLKDWKEAINYYLQTGRQIGQHQKH